VTVVNVDIAEESRTRYLTYALSVVSSRALPDVRDGLKPVQRRILYAMLQNLRLTPEHAHRKSAAVVGEVLARYHPHGDTACYEAMVRMAQDFSLRYPLVDGQGNFGSLDGDSAAAYRYTEAKLTDIALEVLGDIGQETVAERDNFDQTAKEPVVLPSRLPNLLMNGSAGIAVGMATAIPPHNLTELVKGLLLAIEDPEITDSKLLNVIKGPDFPTGCLILNSRSELKTIYSTGRGAIRMRAAYELEKTGSGSRVRERIVISSVPYGIDKSDLIAKIADLIITRKVPQLSDIRDESTDIVRIVLEVSAGADPEKAMAYLFKHTALQQNFYVNLTALVPTANALVSRPEQLSLRAMLLHFIDFRIKVTQAKLQFERAKLSERIHLLEGLASVIDLIEQVIKIVRSSSGRSDAAQKLQKRFKLSEAQAYFIVDLRVYQLSKTSIEEVTGELEEKRKRVAEIDRILKSERAIKGEIAADLQRILAQYGDSRRSPVVSEFEEPEFDKEEYVQHEDAYVIVSRDGWLKRIRTTSDPQATRIREGDALFFVEAASTRDTLVLFTSFGNTFGTQVFDLSHTTGFGEPVQKMFRFGDGEQIVGALILKKENGDAATLSEPEMHAPEQAAFTFAAGGKPRKASPASNSHAAKAKAAELLLFTKHGYGFRLEQSALGLTKKVGKRVMRLGSNDALQGICPADGELLLLVTEQGYGTCFLLSEVPALNAGSKGVILQRVPDGDALCLARSAGKKSSVAVITADGKARQVDVAAMTIGSRAKRGLKVVKRGGKVIGLAPVQIVGR